MQYQKEERSLIANRVRVARKRFEALMDVMREDIVTDDGYVARLRTLLARHYGNKEFESCLTMGELVYMSIQLLLPEE